MSMIILSSLAVLMFVTRLLKRRRAFFILSALAVVFFLAVGSGVIPKVLLKGLQTRGRLNTPVWKNKNAIIVFGSGTNKWPQTPISESPTITSHLVGYSRIFEAARLYTLCKTSAIRVCRIYVSGGDPAGNGISEAQVMSKELQGINIPGEDIVIESKSNNTFQNAQFTSTILQTDNNDYVILVTSGLHMSRSLTYLSHFHISATGSPADHIRLGFSLIPVASHFLFFDTSIHEYGGLVRYWIYSLLGWNPTVSEPGSV